MSDKTKTAIVLGLNLVFSGVLGFGDIYGWNLGIVGPIGLIVAIVLDTWAGIKWIPPNKQ